MFGSIPERDWKIIRDLKPTLLDRLCQRILHEAVSQATEPSQTAHERYLAVYRLLQSRDRDIADAFNGLSRSRAMLCLMNTRKLGLLTDEELDRFSDETKAEVIRYTTEN